MIWLSFVLVAAFAQLCAGQAAGWGFSNQINATMVYWQNPRAAVIRDTFYLDGGYLWWKPGLSNGLDAPVVNDANPLGLVYQLNFSTPFNTSQNISNVFTTISKATGGGDNAANNIFPNYVDGGMFANDYEWYTYGGLLTPTNEYSDPDEKAVATYQKYESGPPKSFHPGFVTDSLPSNFTITRYVTDGAAVSIPSENLGFYFGGLRAADWGEIYFPDGNETTNADVESPTLIGVDMTNANSPIWTNDTLPSTVQGRASAELAWIPVSSRGVLIAIGGVINPSFDNVTLQDNATEAAASNKTSPTFMSTVSVYDIANKIWYNQPTTGDNPGALALGCTVVASAQDHSSHNIYWYGGFNGIDETAPFSDDVYVLSIPSFTWTKVYPGNSTHGRASHKCAKPYPDQMIIVGGYNDITGYGGTSQLEDGIIQIFNLSDPSFLTSYSPAVWSEYTIPSAILSTIGGTPTGGATMKSPSSGFANSSMTDLFGTPYNYTKITTWYPYPLPPTNSSTNGTTPSVTKVVSKSGTPAYLGPVLGVVLGLFVITLLILAFILYRRRRVLGLSGGATPSEMGTLDNRGFVFNWLRGTPADVKAPTVTTEETGNSDPYSDSPQLPVVPEMAVNQVHEMMDTSQPSELQTNTPTGFGYIPIPYSQQSRHTSPIHPPHSATSPQRSELASSPSNASRASKISAISESSASRPALSPQTPGRADSATKPPTPQHERGGSDFSGVSEEDVGKGHLRGISETSVSTVGNGHGEGEREVFATPMEIPEEGVKERVVSALTPPIGVGGGDGGDYLGVKNVEEEAEGSGTRKSNFSEGLDEVEK